MTCGPKEAPQSLRWQEARESVWSLSLASPLCQYDQPVRGPVGSVRGGKTTAQAPNSTLPIFVNGVLLEHNPAHLFT